MGPSKEAILDRLTDPYLARIKILNDGLNSK